jgi:hypothetical protein
LRSASRSIESWSRAIRSGAWFTAKPPPRKSGCATASVATIETLSAVPGEGDPRAAGEQHASDAAYTGPVSDHTGEVFAIDIGEDVQPRGEALLGGAQAKALDCPIEKRSAKVTIVPHPERDRVDEADRHRPVEFGRTDARRGGHSGDRRHRTGLCEGRVRRAQQRGSEEHHLNPHAAPRSD